MALLSGVPLRYVLLFICLLAGDAVACGAQTVASAQGPARALWGGVEVANFNPDYACGNNFPFACSGDLWGMGVSAGYRLSSRMDVNAEARWLEWDGRGGETQASYLAGPQYRVWEHDRLSVRGEFLMGVGHLATPNSAVSCFAYAPGAEASYQVAKSVESFISYEYQFWPSFSSAATFSNTGQVMEHNHGLTPNGFSFGARWRFF